MTTEEKVKSDVQVIAGFFLEGVPAKEKMEAIKGLTPADKKQLADGIRDGSFTY